MTSPTTPAPTPLTDQFEIKSVLIPGDGLYVQDAIHNVVPSSFARTLESELAAAKVEIAELKRRLGDIASIGRRMGYALKRGGQHDKLVQQCVELFKKYGLGGNVIRTES